MPDDPFRERYAHIFAGLSAKDLEIYEGSMAKDFPGMSEADRKEAERAGKVILDGLEAARGNRVPATPEKTTDIGRARVRDLEAEKGSGREGVRRDSWASLIVPGGDAKVVEKANEIAGRKEEPAAEKGQTAELSREEKGKEADPKPPDRKGLQGKGGKPNDKGQSKDDGGMEPG